MDLRQASIARWDKAAAATRDDGVGFAMTDATLAEIEGLFKIIDVDESGTITQRDFQLQAAAVGIEGERSDSGGSSLADSRFTQLLHYFDQDGDRCVLVWVLCCEGGRRGRGCGGVGGWGCGGCPVCGSCRGEGATLLLTQNEILSPPPLLPWCSIITQKEFVQFFTRMAHARMMDNDLQAMINAFVVEKTQEMLELINDVRGRNEEAKVRNARVEGGEPGEPGEPGRGRGGGY